MTSPFDYLARGWPVFPCHSIERGRCTCNLKEKCDNPGKHPLTQHGFKDASTDLNVINGWLRLWPWANWALPTGPITGFTVIDIDHRHGGYDSFAQLQQQRGPMPDTLRSATGGGGRHLFYTHPPGFVIPSVRGWMPGIDIKSDGGYVILPEGKHKSGMAYRWLNLDALAPSVLPPDIARMILDRPASSPGGYTSAGGFAISGVLSGLPEGERNDAIFRFCCWLRRHYHDDREFVFANAAIANARCVPPMSEQELCQCVESAFKQDHDTVSRETSAWVRMLDAGEGWEEPIPLHSPAKLPPFPVHVLPPVIKNWCEAVSHELQMPIELAAGLVFAVIATAFVGRVKIDVKPGWKEQGTLYVIGFSRPGTMKSALARRAFAPIVTAQKQMRTVAEEQIRHARARAEVLRAIVAALKKDLAKRPGDQDLRNQLEEAQFHLDTHKIPTLPVLVISDATPEALETVMSEQDERVSVLDSEGGGLETLLGARYGREGTSNLDLVLKAYSGSEPHDVRRVKRETKMIENPCMAIGGIVQPAIFEKIKGVSNTEERGFIQRLMVYAPKDRLGERAFRTEPVPDKISDAYHWLVVNLVYRLWGVPPGGSLTLTFSPQARELITRWQEVVEPRLAEDADLADMAEFISKLAGKAARIAAILHVAKHSDTGTDPFAEPISEETLHSALEIANHQIDHFRFVTRLSGMSPLAQLADRLVKHIVSHGLTEITRRDAQRHLKTLTADAVDPVLDLLEDRGYIRGTKMTRRASGPGREPSQRYEINPTLWREEK